VAKIRTLRNPAEQTIFAGRHQLMKFQWSQANMLCCRGILYQPQSSGLGKYGEVRNSTQASPATTAPFEEMTFGKNGALFRIS